jgi:tetratricopeptide (TPR) repeat protein
LDLDPNLAEAHVALGHYDLVYARNYSEAEKEFETAIRLRPNYAAARQYYAYYLTAMGRLNEAIAERKRAVDLDPASPLLNAALGEAYYEAHEFNQSITHNQDALSLDPHYAVALINVGRSLEQKKLYPHALTAFRSILAYAPNDPAVLAFLGHIYAVSGQQTKAQTVATQLEELRKTRYVSSLYIALVYTGLGQKDKAFKWLNEAYDERCDYLVYLPTEPLADPLRHDPRFDELLQRLRLPKIESQAVATITP